MAEKLSEAAWTTFAKKRDLDDAALVKALARLDKTDAARHEARLDALDEVVTQFKKLNIALAKRAKELGDKPFKEAKDKLNELLDEAEKLQKSTRADKDNAGDDEEESPALLTSKMIPLLRELRKGEARMPALIALVGKDTAVLISRRAISPSRRKLVAEASGGSGAAKYVNAECVYEGGVLTFIVQSAAGGLAKRLRLALLTQTDMRLKVRVRGDDGEEADGEEGESEQGGGTQPGTPSPQGGIPPAPPLPQSTAPGTASPTASTDAPSTAPSPAAQAWAQRLPGVQQRLAQALRAQHPETAKLRKLIEFAADKANTQKDHAGALKALDMLEQVLDAPVAPGSAPTPQPQSPAPGGSRIAPAIVYTQTRLVWGATRSKIQGELKKLEQAILDHYQGQAAMPQITQSVRKLDGVLALFDESLSDALDNALNAEDAAKKQHWHDEARAIIARYQTYLATDPIVQELDDNPFVPIAVQSTLSGSLATLAAKIV